MLDLVAGSFTGFGAGAGRRAFTAGAEGAVALHPAEQELVRLYRGETYPTYKERLLWKFMPGKTAFSDAEGAGLFYSPNLETARMYADRALSEKGTARILYSEIPKREALDKYIWESKPNESFELQPIRRRMSEAGRMQRTDELLSGKLKNPEFTIPKKFRNSGKLVPSSVFQAVPPKVDDWAWIGNSWLGKLVLS